LMDEIESLKSQLATKERERVETIETLHAMEQIVFLLERSLRRKLKNMRSLKRILPSLKERRNMLKRSLLKKIKFFYERCNHLWKLCENCYDKFGAKPEDPC
jgi:predicted  nucleic acid-binding Zn-ribbon protein